MVFHEHIARVAAHAPDNSISDGQFTCHYRDLPALLQRFNAGFAASSVAGVVALECNNSLPGALALLALLYEQRPVVLLPPRPATNPNQNMKPVPEFAASHITVAPNPPADSTALHETPAQFVQIAPTGNRPDPLLPHGAGMFYLRTSGSMSKSKIVVHSQHNIIGNALNCVAKYQFASSDRIAVPIPIAHMYGFGALFLPAVLTGASVTIIRDTNVLKYLEREKKFQPTITFVTPALAEMLLQGFRSPRSYKLVVTSGQRIGDELFQAFNRKVGDTLVNQYGSSEMGAIAACTPADPLDTRLTTIGTPMQGVALRCADPASETPAQLLCQHPYGYAGYVDDTGAWLQQTSADEWYATGDLAAPTAGGSFRIIGRAQNSINRRGYLVHLDEIESKLETLAAIQQVAVIATDVETKQGREMVAFCTLKRGHKADPRHLRLEASAALPNYALPDRFAILHTLPMLASGKVDRQTLRQQAHAPADDQTDDQTDERPVSA